MSKPTIIKGPLPGEAVEAFRQSHGGALPYELQPCPFCGHDEAAFWKEGDVLHIVKCMFCGSRTPPMMTQDGARTIWNSRHAYVNGDSVRLDWMLANSAYRVMGSDERGWRAMDCNDGIVIIGSGKTAREAIDAAMTRRDISLQPERKEP